MEIYNDLLPDPLPTEPMALAGAWLATALAARQQLPVERAQAFA